MEFNSIWNRYEKHLLNFIHKKTGEPEFARDLLQEVAIKFHKALQDQHIKNSKAWLFQVTRNTISDHYRAQKTETVSWENISLTIKDDPDRETCICDLSGFVIKNYLPEKYGPPLYLADLKQMPQKEVAEKLQLSLPATKSRIQRARKMLKNMIEDCFQFSYTADGNIADYTLKKDCHLPEALKNEMDRINLML
ncbi:MAG: sigma-70 family RNA polymerase sigma factor [Bacteroidetes bacterium]|jgi:RNA polymerase sigma-70 factor (ECF subfamily)|nr:sigma-70 family RNA polymerase sigma factor [Bacteroidota bacterium]